MASEYHVLGLSGGRDSAALAVYMRQHRPELDIKYFFTDTGKELPEAYEFLDRLEGFLGSPIERLNSGRDFGYWLDRYNHFLPSARARWCTRKMKLEPFERWLRPMLDSGATVYSYVAIRSDEVYRKGYVSRHDRLEIRLPFMDAGVDKEGVLEILEGVGLGLPGFYEWRSRSGCTFCFFQQRIEWAGLKERHPEAFEEAKAYEKDSPFTWIRGEPLAELERPGRVAEIKAKHGKRLARENLRRSQLSLLSDDDEATEAPCLICHK